MTFPLRKRWQSIAYPYNFGLKEGPKIKENPLDYNLIIILVSHHETLPSPPKASQKISAPPI